MLFKPRSSQPAKMPFIAGAVVVAAVVATLGLTRGDLVATALATPFSAATFAAAPTAHPMSCEEGCHHMHAAQYLTPNKSDTLSMERVVLAQIAAARRNDAPAVCRYASALPGSAFASDPTTSLQRLALLATADKFAFSDVKTGPCRHDGYLTVTGSVKGHPMYTADYTVVAANPGHPDWSVSSVNVTLAAPLAPTVAGMHSNIHPMLPDAARI